MKIAAIIYLSSIVICIISATIICCMGLKGWGWFLFVAAIMATGFSYTENTNK